jgi:hypothetical protein
LASAIEYAAQSKLHPLEWKRFFIEHYPDQAMEKARCETVRIFHEYPMGPLPREAKNQIYEIASRLRQGTF